MFEVEAIPAFRDNYVWAIHDRHGAVLVDPGEPGPILTWLDSHKLKPSAILLTHHHADHTGGVDALLARWAIPVYGPPGISGVNQPVADGDTVTLAELDLAFRVLATPGHTLDHLCYLGHGRLFSGDTLFSCGCGRLFEGTPEQMHTSLTRLADLPGDTLVHCAHEYTLANIAFAQEVDPDNADLQARHREALAQRRQGLPTLPVPLARECRTNPFLRCHAPALIVAASQHLGIPIQPGLEVFTALREWKNSF